jgi:elongation factor 1-gamma
VLRWFNTCVNQPQFEAVIGTVVLAEKELTPSGAPAVAAAPAAGKKEKKEKAPKEQKPKEEKKPKVFVVLKC